VIKGIEHAAIAAADAATLAEWYVSVLGWTVNYRSSNAIFVKSPDGSMIEIIHSEGERGSDSMKAPGLRHLALAVDDDFETVFTGLRVKGVNFLTEPHESKGNKVVFFTDPEGNILHLIQRAAPLP
jgi:catechol 2,3-dioxygenase-like lactoylglutathione lyase family enzyme